MKITVKAVSSGEEPYEVTFVQDDVPPWGSMRLPWGMYCTCQAGMNRLHCKHRLELLSGDVRRLLDPADEPALREALSWPGSVKASEAKSLIDAELKEIEKEAAAVKAREKKVKKKLAELLDPTI